MTTPFTPSSAYVPPTYPDVSLEAQLARILTKVPPFLRLPRVGTRCPYTQLSRTGLSELVTPTQRNRGKPPVQARCHHSHKHAQRGIWLIPAEALFRYLLNAGTRPTGFSQATSLLSVDYGDESAPASNAACSLVAARGIQLNEDYTSTDGYHEVTRSAVQQSRPSRRPEPGLSVHLSLNPHMIFVPKTSFGNRAVGGRLVKTIVPDDESLPPVTFIEIDEDEWASETRQARWAGN